MTVRDQLGCLLCGLSRKPEVFGLDEKGAYNPEARSPPLVLYRRHFGGRANLVCEKLPVPVPLALGIRDALKAALARVEADLTEAGVDFASEDDP